MPACSAGCVRSIVALSASVSRESASKVSPAWVKKSDCSSASGATTRAASASSEKNRPRRVSRSASVRMTGARWPNTRGSSSMAGLRYVPRPASAVPKP